MIVCLVEGMHFMRVSIEITATEQELAKYTERMCQTIFAALMVCGSATPEQLKMLDRFGIHDV